MKINKITKKNLKILMFFIDIIYSSLKNITKKKLKYKFYYKIVVKI